MAMTLKGKVAIVAGPWAEVVGSTVQQLLKDGATVVVPAKSAGEIKSLQTLVGKIGTGHLVTLLVNYPDYDKASEVREAIIEKFGPIDLAVVCFDSLPLAVFRDLTETNFLDWEKMIEQNITAFFIAARVLLNGMMKCRHGSFISVRDLDGPRERRASPFSELSDSLVTEMARLFFSEAERFDVKCFHLSVKHISKAEGTSPTGPRVPVSDIGRFIMNIFYGHETRCDDRFQSVMLERPGDKTLMN